MLLPLHIVCVCLLGFWGGSDVLWDLRKSVYHCTHIYMRVHCKCAGSERCGSMHRLSLVHSLSFNPARQWKAGQGLGTRLTHECSYINSIKPPTDSLHPNSERLPWPLTFPMHVSSSWRCRSIMFCISPAMSLRRDSWRCWTTEIEATWHTNYTNYVDDTGLSASRLDGISLSLPAVAVSDGKLGVAEVAGNWQKGGFWRGNWGDRPSCSWTDLCEFHLVLNNRGYSILMLLHGWLLQKCRDEHNMYVFRTL